MNARPDAPSRIVLAAMTIALLVLLAAGVLLGGLLYTALALSSSAADLVRRVRPAADGVSRDPGGDGEVIEGSFEVVAAEPPAIRARRMR